MENSENKTPFKMEIDCAEKQIHRASKALEKVDLLLESGNLQGALDCAFDFSSAVEKLLWTAREMPACTGHPLARKKIKQSEKDHLPVRIGFTPEGWFGLIIPALLPKKYKGTPVIFEYPLYYAMEEFFRHKLPRKRYKDCVIIFRHIYQRDRPERRYRDHDNIEVKTVIDIVAYYVMYDDGPLKFRH